MNGLEITVLILALLGYVAIARHYLCAYCGCREATGKLDGLWNGEVIVMECKRAMEAHDEV